MADTHTDTGAVTLPFRIPSGTEVYDALMGQIEPELVTANLPHLDEPYAGETPAAHTARYERYRVAYEKYDEAFARWSNDLSGAVHAYRADVLHSAEAQSRAEESATMAEIESHMLPS